MTAGMTEEAEVKEEAVVEGVVEAEKAAVAEEEIKKD
jgi:hypothetical protein